MIKIVVLLVISYLINNFRNICIDKEIFKLSGIKPESKKEQQELGLKYKDQLVLPIWLWIPRILSLVCVAISIILVIQKIMG